MDPAGVYPHRRGQTAHGMPLKQSAGFQGQPVNVRSSEEKKWIKAHRQRSPSLAMLQQLLLAP